MPISSDGSTPIVSFEDVSKRYRLGSGNTSLRAALSHGLRRLLPSARGDEALPDFWAVKGLSFELKRGEAIGFIGPNGAGKTTVLKLLANITQPTTGKLDVRGRVSALIELGAGFHPDLTGRENIYLNAAILGLSSRGVDRIFDQIVAFSGLERFIDTPVKRYSSGMYVRLGFSIAAHIEPNLLLVDEVLAVGDSQFRQRCAQRIEELQTMGTSIVFVAHNLYLVRSVCDRAIFLRGGEVQAQGEVGEVIQAYEMWLHQEAEHELAPLPDEITTAETQLYRIELRDPSGKIQEEFAYDETVELRIFYRVASPIPKPNVVARILRADGTTCCMIRTADYGFRLPDLHDKGVISLTLTPLQLAGGAYTVEVRLLGEIDGIPFAQRHSPWFRVRGLSPNFDESGGVFVPHVASAHVEPELVPIDTRDMSIRTSLG